MLGQCVSPIDAQLESGSPRAIGCFSPALIERRGQRTNMKSESHLIIETREWQGFSSQWPPFHRQTPLHRLARCCIRTIAVKSCTGCRFFKIKYEAATVALLGS